MKAREPPDAPIVGSLDGIGEEAGRQLAARPVVGDALAADSFPGAGVVAAVAVFHVLVLVGAFLFSRWTHVPVSRSFRFSFPFPVVFRPDS